MKCFRTLLAAAAPLILFGACTVTDDTSDPTTGGAGAGAGASDGTGGTDPNGAGGAGGAGGAKGDAEPAIPDPAPEHSEPGAYGCDGCPESDRTSFELDAGSVTSATISGTVTGAEGDGSYYLSGPGGAALMGVVPTSDGDGSYSFELPLFCGQQLLKLLWSNANGTLVEVVSITTEDCVDADIRVTLSWDALGQDWELHLIKPGGTINDDATDCTWTSCIGESPDWGAEGDASDDPHKDVDNTGAYGPENIWLAKPESGTYTVMVEHWASGDPSSSGQVIFNVAGEVVVARMENLAPSNVWTAATIEWPSGKITTSDDVYDCSADWSGGCQADIP